MFLLPGIVGAIVSYLTTGWVVKKGESWGIIDDPNKHRMPKVVHDKPVPRGGGIPIFVAGIVGIILFLPKNLHSLGLIGAMFVLAVTGVLDDRFEEMISPYVRLVINIGAALLVIGAGIGIAYITNPFGGIINLDQPRWCLGNHCIWVLADLFALIWLVGLQNIIGWSSGVDGQLPGFVIIAAVTIGVLAMQTGTDLNQWPVIGLAGITAGAYLGFLPWNWWPQKIMPGYGGKSLAGLLLGVLAIMSTAKVGTLVLVLGVPIIDAALVIIKRISEGRSPVFGGREHLHHYLLDRGWGKRRIALFYWAVSGILAVVAWQLHPPIKLYTMATVVLVLLGGILWLRNWSDYSKRQGPGSG